MLDSSSLFTKKLSDVYAIASVNRLLSRKLFILYVIATTHQPTMLDIQEKTRIPYATLTRILKQLRDEDRIEIEYVRHLREEGKSLPMGKSGYYVIHSWGTLDSRCFLLTYPKESESFVQS